MEDPDTKLLQSVAGSMRGATEKSIRDRCVRGCAVAWQVNRNQPANCCANCVCSVRKWVISLDNMRVRLQAEEPPERPRRGLAAAGAPRSAAIRPRDAASAAGVERAAVEVRAAMRCASAACSHSCVIMLTRSLCAGMGWRCERGRRRGDRHGEAGGCAGHVPVGGRVRGRGGARGSSQDGDARRRRRSAGRSHAAQQPVVACRACAALPCSTARLLDITQASHVCS
jgi:hypothetical protein